MKLSNTLAYFAKQEVSDAYSGSFAFNCRLDTYSGTVRDSLIAGRRTMTVRPATVIPIRRVVEVNDRQYVVGEDFIDNYNTGILKQHFLLHPADGLATIAPAAQIISGTGGTEAFVGISWRKDRAEEEKSPHRFNVYNMYISVTEAVDRDYLVLVNSRYYRVQNIERTTGGFLTLYAVELGANAVSTISYIASSGLYNPVTDSTTVAAPISVSALVERYQDSYLYDSADSEKYRVGDKIITVDALDIVEVEVKDKFTVSGTSYKIISVVSDGLGAWCCHVRQA